MKQSKSIHLEWLIDKSKTMIYMLSQQQGTSMISKTTNTALGGLRCQLRGTATVFWLSCPLHVPLPTIGKWGFALHNKPKMQMDA
jgi:predicted membrane-bound spermidine synthase